MKEQLKKVIVALDVLTFDEAKVVVDELGNNIEWYKVGPVLFTRSGAEIIDYLHRKNKKIFLDLKLHDTPIVVGQTVRQFADMGVRFATVHCLGGREMLEVAGAHCRGSSLKLLGVTVLTSHQEHGLPIPGVTTPGKDLVLQMLNLAMETRLAGILCSPHELKLVRPLALPQFVLVTPGIRLKGKEVFEDDQKRIATPAEAIEWGADYLIVGRPLTQAREPKEVIQHLFN